MNEVIKDILSRFEKNDVVSINFPYFRNGQYSINACKEMGCRFEIWTNAIVIGLNPEIAQQKLDNLISLSLACGIPIKETDFELAKVNKNTWLIIRGWWARNVVRRELSRLIIKSGNFVKIEDIVRGNYQNYFVGSPSLRLMFSKDKFKTWVESIRNFKVDKTLVGSGLFQWYQNGYIKI